MTSNTKRSWMGNAVELPALGLLSCLCPGWGCATWEGCCPTWLQPLISLLPPIQPQYPDLPLIAPVITPQPLQLSRELPPNWFKPAGMKPCGANCMSQRCGFPIKLSQFSSWLLCPTASGSRSLPWGLTETLRHCQGTLTLLEPCREPSQGASQTQTKPYQQKLFCQYRSLSKLSLGIDPENRSRAANCTGSAASANQGREAWVVHLLHTGSLQSLPATAARTLQASQPAGHPSTSLVLSCKEVLIVDGPWKDLVQIFSPMFTYSNVF